MSPDLFTTPFWLIFAAGVVVSLVISTIYGRRAIHPRLRPHFGLVVIVFLMLTLVSFFAAVVLGRIATGGVRTPAPQPAETQPDQPDAAPPAESPAEPE